MDIKKLIAFGLISDTGARAAPGTERNQEGEKDKLREREREFKKDKNMNNYARTTTQWRTV